MSTTHALSGVDHGRGPSQRTLIGAVAGGLAGLLLGVIATVAVIVWAVVEVSNGAPSATVPGIVDVSMIGDTLSAESAVTVVVPAIVLIVVGSVVGALLGRRRRS